MGVANHQETLRPIELAGAVKNAAHSLTKPPGFDGNRHREVFTDQSPQLHCKHQAICDDGSTNAAHKFTQDAIGA
jgi:hypothetical protein